ncbi:Imm32 family immunity protein [Thiolinea disciformis]|uniref:Imm32 family immunity protein n=1 Tax=Thiolinea disciformis TaxID=125614 RepID=UPI00036AC231|nr:hypothetical protein [Thiolinea disciformis]
MFLKDLAIFTDNQPSYIELAIEGGEDSLKCFGHFLLNLESDLNRLAMAIPDSPYPQSYANCLVEIDEALVDANLKIKSSSEEITFIASKEFFRSLGYNCINLANSNRGRHTHFHLEGDCINDDIKKHYELIVAIL